MRNKLILGAMIAILVSSCRKDEYIFDQSPDERLNEALSNYQAVLMSSPTGWKATLQPALGGTYNFFFQFNNENRVFMYADVDTATTANRGESSYRLKAMQQPTLIFDTYSYLHILADPDASKNGGIYGQGLISDFEFIFQSASEDSIVLTGKANDTKLKLERATQAELDAWQNGTWTNILSFLKFLEIETYFKRLTLGGITYELAIDPISRVIRFQWLSSGNLQTFITGYSFGSEGVTLNTPLVNGSQTINQLSNFSWNAGTQTLQLSSGGSNGSITGAAAPLRVDLQAPRRWWQRMIDLDGEWRSVNGFHVNGQQDAYGLHGIENYVALAFFPEFSVSGGITYDLVGYLMFENSQLTLNFGTAFQAPTFTADGRIRFGEYLGDLGDIPDDAEEPYVNTALKMMDSNGFYLVQLSETEYDMVSAADAKSWISWFSIR